MRKIFKTAIAAVTTTAMVASLFVGMPATEVSAATTNVATGTWSSWYAPGSWGNGNTRANSITSFNSNSFVADVTTTGWAACWKGVNQPESVGDDFDFKGGAWGDNPISCETFMNGVKIVSGSEYKFKFTIKNMMKNDKGSSEKNVTVLVCTPNVDTDLTSDNFGMVTSYDDDSTYLKTTVRLAADEEKEFEFNVTPYGDEVAIVFQYGPYIYSFNGGKVEGFALAEGTKEDANLSGKLVFSNISFEGEKYESGNNGGNNNSGNNGSSNSGSNNNGSSNSGSNNNSGSNANTGSSNKPNVSKPAQVKSVKVKNLKGKKAKISWAKVKTATKYQVKIGSKKYTSKKNTYTVKKGLKKKKTYKVYVRAYNKAGYGKWSKVKKVKITK